MEVPSTGTVLDVLVALARTANLPVSYPSSSTKTGARAGVPHGQGNGAPAAVGGTATEVAGGGAMAEAAAVDGASVPKGAANQPESSGATCQGLPRVEGVLSCAKVRGVASRAEVALSALCA